jgi:2-amino-4,5-dihydroxy-6-oxo-7-(phosphooxy)heptanoate synthase
VRVGGTQSLSLRGRPRSRFTTDEATALVPATTWATARLPGDDMTLRSSIDVDTFACRALDVATSTSLRGAGKRRRLSGISGADGRFLFVPMDHSVSDGPIASVSRFRRIVCDVAAAGADALIVHKGRAAAIADLPLDACSLVVHLSASTSHGPDVNAKVLVGSVEDAVRLGAAGVSIHVNIGAPTEADQLRDFGVVASDCERYGMPLLAMMYARGAPIADEHDSATLAHLVAIAIDLGADIVKTVVPQPLETVSAVIDSSSVPVVFSGGSPGSGDPRGLLFTARTVVAAGGAGLAAGRRVWADPDPARVVRSLVNAIHTEPLDSVQGKDVREEDLG